MNPKTLLKELIISKLKIMFKSKSKYSEIFYVKEFPTKLWQPSNLNQKAQSYL